MTTNLPETIELHATIPRRVEGGAAIGGYSRIDDKGHPELNLSIVDDSGERNVQYHEGDTFEFAGATWRVEHAFGPSMSGRARIAKLSRVG